MSKLKNKHTGKNILVVIKEYFSLIAIGSLILGYLSFYSYAARYSLSYVTPDITFTTGIGIFCLLLIYLFYAVAKFRSIYRGIRVMLLIYFLSILSGNLLLLFSFFYGVGFGENLRLLWFKRPVYKKLKLRYFTANKNDRKVTLIVSAIFFLVGIFLSLKLFIVYIFIDSFIQEIQYSIFIKIRPINLFVLIILLPIFMFGYFIENSNYSLFGMTQQSINITRNDSTTYKATLIFKDGNNLYLRDSSYVPLGSSLNNFSYNSILVKIEDIKSYKTFQDDKKIENPGGLIDIFKKIKHSTNVLDSSAKSK